MRRIVGISREEKVVGVFESLKEASLATGISEGRIAANLKGFGPKYIRGVKFIREVIKEDLK